MWTAVYHNPPGVLALEVFWNSWIGLGSLVPGILRSPDPNLSVAGWKCYQSSYCYWCNCCPIYHSWCHSLGLWLLSLVSLQKSYYTCHEIKYSSIKKLRPSPLLPVGKESQRKRKTYRCDTWCNKPTNPHYSIPKIRDACAGPQKRNAKVSFLVVW